MQPESWILGPRLEPRTPTSATLLLRPLSLPATSVTRTRHRGCCDTLMPRMRVGESPGTQLAYSGVLRAQVHPLRHSTLACPLEVVEVETRKSEASCGLGGGAGGGGLRTSFVQRLLAKVRSNPTYDPAYAPAGMAPPPPALQMQYSPPAQYSPQPPSLESQLLQAVQRQQQEEALMARLAGGGGSPVAASLAAPPGGGWGISPQLQQRAYATPQPLPLPTGVAQDPAMQLLLLQQQQQLQQLHQQLQQQQSQRHP